MKIDKVIMSIQDSDNMEEINRITHVRYDAEDNWCDLGCFIEYPELMKFISEDVYEDLFYKKADYVAFRLDW